MRLSLSLWAISQSSMKYDGKEMQMDSWKKKKKDKKTKEKKKIKDGVEILEY